MGGGGDTAQISAAALIGITACARGRPPKAPPALPARSVQLALFLGSFASLAITLLPPFFLGENRVPGATVRSREPAQLGALRSLGAGPGPGQPVLGDLRGAESVDRGDTSPHLPAAPSSHRSRAAQAAAGGHEGKRTRRLHLLHHRFFYLKQRRSARRGESAFFLNFSDFFPPFSSFWGSCLCNTSVL